MMVLAWASMRAGDTLVMPSDGIRHGVGTDYVGEPANAKVAS